MIEVAENRFPKGLLLDLETSPDGRRILKIGAVFGVRTLLRTGHFEQSSALVELDRFAEGAECVVGHNLLEHDLAVLAECNSNLALLKLPVVDTLFLSPICFPENPYHSLVKDYKLVSESLNDPVADARLAATLLGEEIGSLKGMAQVAPEAFRALRILLCAAGEGDKRLALGMRWVMDRVGTAETEAFEECRPLLRRLIGELACKTGAAFLTETRFDAETARWAFAYALTWLRVAGADSVLPPWVRRHNPLVIPLLAKLRDVPCDSPDCAYCQAMHNPEALLKRFFGFDEFRATPPDAAGGSLQRTIVIAGLRNESLLAILPTGGGKSLCFQLPALARNLRRGQLTIIVSPLQALMKDQVDGLVRRTGMNNAAALSGLLTPPERGEVLRAIRTGRLALLYISPEQLRGRAFREAVTQREIGCWVLDEAHCLSKWGHDFRPDYLYVGRFIRELANRQGEKEPPPVACFTATAKRDVVDEIIAYFQRELGSELTRYEGGVERDNLHFEVQTVAAQGKLPRIHELLAEHLVTSTGSAVVFRALRKDAEETAQFLKDRGWAAEKFHAGLIATEKKRIQDAFLAGELRVICATNAFGMGIDKDDVRLVVHGDTPGSIENYLQEAGRAGRDRDPARCVLLYDEADCEQQFRLGSFSELSRRDIAQLLRGLRKAARTRKSDEVVITTGELLRDEDIETEFDAQDPNADTKVRAAVAWLERAGFVERNENRTNVIQARLLVKNIDEAHAKLEAMNLSQREGHLWLAVVRAMVDASETDMLSVDMLAMLPEFAAYIEGEESGDAGRTVRDARSTEYLTSKVFKVLDNMMGVGILKKDTLLTAYVRYKVADPSSERLRRALKTDRAFLALLQEEAPDPEGWLPLNLRLVNDELLARDVHSSPEVLRQLLHSLSEDGRGFAGQSGSIDCRYTGHDLYRIRVRREWAVISELAERRRNVSARAFEAILASVPSETPPRADLLVSFSFEALQSALEADLALRSDIRDMQAAIERGLMYLHEQQVVTLQRGLAIFRSAMTVRILPEADKQRYTSEHYDALQHHYRERVFQVHVMNEYARFGLDRIRAALDFVVAYFSIEKEAFIERFFANRRELLERATTATSYGAIVDSLGSKDQTRIVVQPPTKNLLILAGPGSGKTRTVVHRCAYLVRVKRARPRSILVCAFNHKAVVELRRRLAALIGRDAVGVTIQTYHGLALRILGHSFRSLADKNGDATDLDKLIVDAVAVLRSNVAEPGLEPDEVRDRLLAGFQHILVDEYQDIDAPQYELIGAIAGRTLSDGDRRLSILAVGDDDQSIYGFRGANVEFIRRFGEDYKSDTAFLVENYRSTRHIIDAANRVIARNRDRMKTDKDIRIDTGRRLFPAGGLLGERDVLTRGRVAVVEVADAQGQAHAVLRELRRLRSLGMVEWSDIAVLARNRRDLSWIRAAAEAAGIPVAWPLDRNKTPPPLLFREVRALLRTLDAERHSTQTASDLQRRFAPEDGGLTHELLGAWAMETGDEPTPVEACVEFLYEALSQRRREEHFGSGVVLSTVHAAKGMEYPHVLLCGDWSSGARDSLEEERRVLYVGMTRAKQTLSLFVRTDCVNPFAEDFVGPCFAPRRETLREAVGDGEERDYALLGLEDIYLDYAGRLEPGHPAHAAMARLRSGDRLNLVETQGRIALATPDNVVVAVLSSSAAQSWRPRLAYVERAQIVAMLTRRARNVRDPDFAKYLRSDQWDIPCCELVIRSLSPVPPKST